jgi:transcriptional antiterminator RfaH
MAPDDLLEEGALRDVAGRLWWVLHTRPRQEKSLARQLHAGHVPFYLPVVSRRCRMRGRTMTSRVPLFPGYVFLLADAEERVAALATCRVARTIRVTDQERLWGDLRQIHRLISCGAPITSEERLVPGMPVEIRSGPLAGLKGKILRTASGRRFVVEVDFIQKGASVLLEDFMLEKAGQEGLHQLSVDSR